MTLSKEIRRLVLPGIVLSILMLGSVAAAPGFTFGRPAFGVAPRPLVTSRGRLDPRGDGDLRHAGRNHDGGGRFAGGVGIAILPIVPPGVEPAAVAPAGQGEQLLGRADERWASDEVPEHSRCVRPLIIDLREPPKTRQPSPRVIYGTAPPVCPRSY